MIDVRLPIGWLFTICGALVAMRGLWKPVLTPAGPNMINLDLDWGIVMLVFGLLMLLLVHKSKPAK